MSFYLIGRNDVAVGNNSTFVPGDCDMNEALYRAGVGMNLPRSRNPGTDEKHRRSDREALLISAFSPNA